MTANPTTLTRNKALVRQLYEQGFNRGDASVFEGLYSKNYRHHNKTIHDISAGGAGEAQSMQRFREAIPDVIFSIEDQIAEGDQVVNKMTVRGTPVKNFPPIEADGRSIEFRAVSIFRIVEGQIEEQWFFREPQDSRPGPVG